MKPEQIRDTDAVAEDTITPTTETETQPTLPESTSERAWPPATPEPEPASSDSQR